MIFNIQTFLANKRLDIYRRTTTPTVRGGITEAYTLVYSQIWMKVEPVSSGVNINAKSGSAELTQEGNTLIKKYAIHIWDSSVTIYDNDLIRDTVANKVYSVDLVVGEPLWRDQQHKLICECSVLGDARYLDFESSA